MPLKASFPSKLVRRVLDLEPLTVEHDTSPHHCRPLLCQSIDPRAKSPACLCNLLFHDRYCTFVIPPRSVLGTVPFPSAVLTTSITTQVFPISEDIGADECIGLTGLEESTLLSFGDVYAFVCDVEFTITYLILEGCGAAQSQCFIVGIFGVSVTRLFVREHFLHDERVPNLIKFLESLGRPTGPSGCCRLCIHLLCGAAGPHRQESAEGTCKRCSAPALGSLGC